MNIRYRIFKLEQVNSQIPDGYHQTNYSVFTLSQTGYQSDFDSYEDAVAYLSMSENIVTSWSEYTILPIFTKI